MKALSIIFYSIGCILLFISCFTTSVSLTWWLGGLAVAFLIGGCIFQYQQNSRNYFHHHNH
ncbi:MAG: hypothetical protein NC328_05650 [Muribaculum sp.]|nr:hypothetical protein [Muribaculum sp.]